MLIENLIFRGEPMNGFCDITTSLEVIPGPIFKLHKCDVETLRTDFTEMKYIYTFIDSGRSWFSFKSFKVVIMFFFCG